MAKMGRPPAADPRLRKVTVRMSESEYKKLIEYNDATGQTLTETMLQGFNLLLDKKKKKRA